MTPELKSDATHGAAAWILVLLGKAGIHTWSDVAAAAATVYTALLIVGLLWRWWKAWQR